MRRKAGKRALPSIPPMASDDRKLPRLPSSPNSPKLEESGPSPSTSTSSSFTTADINALPDPALITVIQHLPWRDRVRVESVNRRWRRLSLDQGWAHLRHFDTRDFIQVKLSSAQVLDGSLAEVLKRCGSRIDSLTLRHIDQTIDLLRHCPNLRHLSIKNVYLTAETVDFLCQRGCCGLK
jgi:hypothetical protein